MYGFAVIGAGFVGLSSARALRERYSGAGVVVVLEEESGWPHHQAGHNSGGIHSGIYYQLGSLKARSSKEGVQRLMEFCQEHGDRRLRRFRRTFAKMVVEKGGELRAGAEVLQDLRDR